MDRKKTFKTYGTTNAEKKGKQLPNHKKKEKDER
jgi:hypothetical protein